MFDFEKLEVYGLIVDLNKDVLSRIYKSKIFDTYLSDQLKRATLSIALNLAEGVGRRSVKDKRHFYVMARASTFESVALTQVLNSQGLISEEEYLSWYGRYEQISKMLFGMIRNINKF